MITTQEILRQVRMDSDHPANNTPTWGRVMERAFNLYGPRLSKEIDAIKKVLNNVNDDFDLDALKEMLNDG